jgi:hypothetical protein
MSHVVPDNSKHLQVTTTDGKSKKLPISLFMLSRLLPTTDCFGGSYYLSVYLLGANSWDKQILRMFISEWVKAAPFKPQPPLASG